MGLSFTYQPPSGGLPEASRYAGGDSLLSQNAIIMLELFLFPCYCASS